MKTLLQRPWIWALFGILVLWILLSIGAGRVNLGNLTGNLAAAALLCVVAIGQTFVVTTGNGAVDLSIPSVMTLSGFVATSVTNGQDARLPLGILAIAALGIGVGWVNASIVNRLRIPPIIATLAVGYILVTATLIYNRGFTTYAVSPLLAYIASGRVVGIPIILLLAIALTAAASWFMHGTVYGRQLSAVGQNSRAAYFAGIKVRNYARSLHLERLSRCFGRAVAFRTSERGVPRNGHSFSSPIGWRCRRRRIIDRRRNGNAPRHPPWFNLSRDDCHDYGRAPRPGRIPGHDSRDSHHPRARRCRSS